MRRGTTTTVLVGVLAIGALVACEPPSPPVTFTVDTTSPAPDHTPGDGTCEATPGAGDCTLPAAVAEANAVPRAAIVVPAGVYQDMQPTITSRVDLNWTTPAAVELGDVALTVDAGARLRTRGLISRSLDDRKALALTVAGDAQIDRSQIELVDPSAEPQDQAPLTVLPTGGVVLTRSFVQGYLTAVDNGGRAFIDASTITSAGARVATTGSGQTALRATVVSRSVNTQLVTVGCTGTAPTPYGHSYYAPLALGCGPLADTDVAPSPAPIVGLVLSPTFAGIDAIPVGTGSCAVGDVDLFGAPRAVDGDGDGTPACDIGAVEYQPPA